MRLKGWFGLTPRGTSTSNVCSIILRVGSELFRRVVLGFVSGGRLRPVADCIPGGRLAMCGGGIMRTVEPGLAFWGHWTCTVCPVELWDIL